MQYVLLFLIVFLSIILYKLLSERKLTYSFIRTRKRLIGRDFNGDETDEIENGLIIIDKDILIVEGEEYLLKSKMGLLPEAVLNIQKNRLITVKVMMENGEKIYFIDPENNICNIQITNSYTDSSPLYIFSV